MDSVGIYDFGVTDTNPYPILFIYLYVRYNLVTEQTFIPCWCFSFKSPAIKFMTFFCAFEPRDREPVDVNFTLDRFSVYFGIENGDVLSLDGAVKGGEVEQKKRQIREIIFKQ